MSDLVNPLVSVCMITYNHESFILQAIEGVLMQQCDFPYELVIGEDYSTDSTRKISEQYAIQYPNILRLLPSEINLGMMPNFIRTLNTCTGKYIAICEGDDYWTDPLKLQKQVDFLEKSTDIGLVHSDADIRNEKTGKVIRNYYKTSKIKIPESRILENIFLGQYPIFTCSTVFRRDLLDKINMSQIFKGSAGDFFLWINFSRITKFGFFPESTCVRRILNESATQSKDIDKVLSFWMKDYNMYKHFLLMNIIDFKLQSKVHWVRGGRVLDIYFRMGNESAYNLYYKTLKNNYGEQDASFEQYFTFTFSRFTNGFKLLKKTKILKILHKIIVTHRRNIKTGN